MNNRGSAAVEATLILPIFIFGMLALYEFCQCRLAENVIYEAACETAEYMAEYGYISEGNIIFAENRFEAYLDDRELVGRYVSGGADGVSLMGSRFRTEDNNVELTITYKLRCDIPLFNIFMHEKSYTLTQHIYCGYENDAETGVDKEEQYVYITDNREVYHITRSCTHLSLSVSCTSKRSAVEGGLAPCEFCGDECGSLVYVTEYGDKYHSGRECSGLKRSIKRVPLSEVEDLPPCSRCGLYN